MAEKQAYMVARGRVQGVYFRATLRREAEQRAVRGWVRNQWDGSVEAVLQGPEEAVNAVLDWARQGPSRAVVESLDVSWSEPDASLTTFAIRD